MAWRVELSPLARREVEALPPKVRVQLAARIDALAVNPRPPSCKKLRGEDFYRVRSGDDRIIDEIHDRVLVGAYISLSQGACGRGYLDPAAWFGLAPRFIAGTHGLHSSPLLQPFQRFPGFILPWPAEENGSGETVENGYDPRGNPEQPRDKSRGY